MSHGLVSEKKRTCGNFSDTSSLKFSKAKGSLGHAFTVCRGKRGETR